MFSKWVRLRALTSNGHVLSDMECWNGRSTTPRRRQKTAQRPIKRFTTPPPPKFPDDNFRGEGEQPIPRQRRAPAPGFGQSSSAAPLFGAGSSFRWATTLRCPKALHPPHRTLKFEPGVKAILEGALLTCHLLTCSPGERGGVTE